LFFRIRGITVDNEENIYVIDWGNYRIQKFDKNGSYIQSFGRWGQGPGEFQHTMRFDIDELSGNLHIRDGGRLIKIGDYIFGKPMGLCCVGVYDKFVGKTS